MKNILITVFIFLLVTQISFAQPGHQGKHRKSDRIEQLEKVKLMEILELNDETGVKFFTRLKEHRDKMRQNNRKIGEFIDEIRVKIENNELDQNDPFVNKFIEETITLELLNAKLRTDFIKSLSDILTPFQVSKFLIFEKSFRNEMQELLLKRGKRGGD